MNGAQFKQQVVAVTGAAGGIGRDAAAAFCDHGARVALLDVESDRVAEAVAVIAKEHGNDAIGVVCDVTDRTSVSKAFASVEQKLGPVDLLVNNAGVGSSARFVELTDTEWDRVMDTNAKGTFLCSQAVVPGMLDRGRGSIINVSSQAAKNGQPLIAHYCASKAAVIGLTRALALELAPTIRVNAVCPGVIDTEMVRQTIAQQADILGRPAEALREAILDSIPLGRLQSPRSVADAILYLAAASEVTGQALDVSGGMVMG